ncbi:MAG TPA: hypothetical protein ENG16_04725 [Archaeoglobus sp.]|nr:hypothetical protein [Archaeoglobus sp.]
MAVVKMRYREGEFILEFDRLEDAILFIRLFEKADIEPISKQSNSNDLEEKIRKYIEESRYEYSTVELLEDICGIKLEGPFTEVYTKNSRFARAYDRVSRIAKKIREEIVKEKGGRWVIMKRADGRQIFKLVNSEV